MLSAKGLVFLVLRVPVSFTGQDKEELNEDAIQEAIDVVGDILDRGKFKNEKKHIGIEVDVDADHVVTNLEITSEFDGREPEDFGVER